MSVIEREQRVGQAGARGEFRLGQVNMNEQKIASAHLEYFCRGDGKRPPTAGASDDW